MQLAEQTYNTWSEAIWRAVYDFVEQKFDVYDLLTGLLGPY